MMKRKIGLWIFVTSLVHCGIIQQREETRVNFSIAVCVSLSLLQVSPITLSDGTSSFLISCPTGLVELGGTAIIFYSDGEVSLVPLDRQGKIDLTKKVKLFSAKAFLHDGGRIISTYESEGKDIMNFGANLQEGDVSIAYFIPADSNFIELFLEGFSTIGRTPELINRRNYIFISTYLSTKNLSNVVFPIFDEIRLFILRNLKVSDLILNFPGIDHANILISLPSSSAGIINEVPPLPVIVPDINFSSLSDISSALPYYESVVTGSTVKIPLFIGDVSDTLSIIAFRDGEIYEGRIPVSFQEVIPSEVRVNMELIPPSDNDVNSAIHFALPEDETTISVEIYSFAREAPLLISKYQVFKGGSAIPIRIPQHLSSGPYYVAVQSEKVIKETDGLTVKDTFAKYKLSRMPYISYNTGGFKSEQFVFDVVVIQDALKLLWRTPDKLDVKNIAPDLDVQIQECAKVENKKLFLNSNCITSFIDIFAEDGRGRNVLVWRIYGIFKRREAELPNFLSPTLIFDIIKQSPEMKLRKVRLNYNAYFGDSLLTFKRTFIFN